MKRLPVSRHWVWLPWRCVCVSVCSFSQLRNVAVAVFGMCPTACFVFPHTQLPLIALLIPPIYLTLKVIESIRPHVEISKYKHFTFSCHFTHSYHFLLLSFWFAELKYYNRSFLVETGRSSDMLCLRCASCSGELNRGGKEMSLILNWWKRKGDKWQSQSQALWERRAKGSK